MENVITLGKLIGLLFLFCHPPPLYFVFENSKNKRNDLARTVMGTIFLAEAVESEELLYLEKYSQFVSHSF